METIKAYLDFLLADKESTKAIIAKLLEVVNLAAEELKEPAKAIFIVHNAKWKKDTLDALTGEGFTREEAFTLMLSDQLRVAEFAKRTRALTSKG